MSERARSRTFLFLMIGVSIAYALKCETGYWATAHLPLDGDGEPIGRDFVNMWMAGHAAWLAHPADWFEPHAYNRAIRRLLGLAASAPAFNWGHPPSILLFTWPLGLLPYGFSYVAWMFVGAGLYLSAIPAPERRVEYLLLLLASPACINDVISGQNGFFIAALFIGALTQLDKRPTLSGILIGLLTIKPQLGLLFPVMLIASRRWRALACAAATAFALFAATSAIYGAHIWADYYRIAIPLQTKIILFFDGARAAALPTMFMTMRSFYVPVPDALIVQLPVTIGALVGVAWAYFRRRDPILSRALFVTASLLATPYLWTYDMIVLVWVVVELRDTRESTPADALLLFAVLAIPVISAPFPFRGETGSVFILIALAGRLVWLLVRGVPNPKADLSSRRASGSLPQPPCHPSPIPP